jgi:uroporphyrinogen-III synthase
MIMRIALTRPHADSERTAAALRARGHEVLVAPLMHVAPVDADLSGTWGAVVITSANAPSVLAGNPARDTLIKFPLFAVGRRSADAATEAGFTSVTSAGGDVRDLVRLIAERRADAKAPLLYLAGEDRAADLAGELTTRGLAVEMRIVYRAVTAPFPPELIAAIKSGRLDAVLHFSARSADNYLAGAAQAGLTEQALTLRHYCLSGAIAAPLSAAGTAKIWVAPRPDEAALIGLLEQA